MLKLPDSFLDWLHSKVTCQLCRLDTSVTFLWQVTDHVLLSTNQITERQLLSGISVKSTRFPLVCADLVYSIHRTAIDYRL